MPHGRCRTVRRWSAIGSMTGAASLSISIGKAGLIALTANAANHQATEYFDARMTGFVAKPVKFAEPLTLRPAQSKRISPPSHRPNAMALKQSACVGRLSQPQCGRGILRRTERYMSDNHPLETKRGRRV